MATDLTIEQQKALAIAQAKRRRAEEGEVAVTPASGTLPDLFKGMGEGALTMLTGAASLPIAGFSGLMAMDAGPDAAADAFRLTQDKLTYRPRSREGELALEAAQIPFAPIAATTDFLGEKATDVTGSPAAGATVRTILEGGPMLLGRGYGAVRGPLSNKQAILRRGQERGYVLPPSDAVPASAVRRRLDSAAGKPRMEMDASVKNQTVTNDLAAESLGLAPGTEITRAALQNVRNEAGSAYRVLQDFDKFNLDTQFRRDLSNAAKSLREIKKEVPALAKADGPIDEALAIASDAVGGGLRGKVSMSSGAVIETVKTLRGMADDAYAAGRPVVGRAYRDMAKAIDDAVERDLARSAPSSAVDDYRAARQRIAKSYTIEEALDGDGFVSAAKVARAKAKGVPLDDNLRLVADMHEQYPQAMRVQKRQPIAQGRLSTMAAAGGGGAAIGGDVAVGLPVAIAALMGPTARAAALSRPVQSMFATPYGRMKNPLADPAGIGISYMLQDDQ